MPTVNPILLASIVGLGLVALGIVALLRDPAPGPSAPGGRPGSADATGPAATPRLANVVTIDPSLCALDRQPGPGDTPVRGLDGGADGGGGDSQGFDPVDWGTGRWRLCLTGPVPVQLEGSAWCQWSDGRDSVIGLDGLDVQEGSATFHAFASVPGGSVSLLRVAGPARATWNAESQPVDPGSSGRAGAVTFILEPLTGEDQAAPSGSSVEPPRPATGTIRWSCGEPPPARPGLATGQITLHLDAPINADWTARARCAWVTGATGTRLEEVSVATELALGDRMVTLSIRPSARFPELIDATVDVRDDHGTGSYSSSGRLIPYRQTDDARTGLVRLRGLVAQPGGGALLGPGVDDASGFASWSCDLPATDGPIRDDANPPVELTVPGTATISFSPAVIEPIQGPVRCQISGEDIGGVALLGIDGTIPVGAGAVLVHGDQGELRLALAGADGLPAGEYRGPLTEIGSDVLFGDLGLRATVEWEPDDPRYVPIGGPAGPRSLSVTATVTCDLRQARIDGLTLGTLDLAIDSGVNRTWSVVAACSWRLRNGVPVVVQAVNAERLVIGDQTFRIFAQQEPFILSERGTRYGRLNESTVGGTASPDGSSGTLTFNDFGPRGRITNINDRLGGRDGPLQISGSISWTCGSAPANTPPEVVPGN